MLGKFRVDLRIVGPDSTVVKAGGAQDQDLAVALKGAVAKLKP